MGDEGKQALHSIIRHTYNYSATATDRHISRLPSHPISCPKVRELHPQAMEGKSCACRFELRGKGYPTPLLHGLRVSDIAVFQRSQKARETKKQAITSTPAESLVSTESPEDLVRKIAELKRHRRGLERSLQRLEGQLTDLFEAQSDDSLELGIGVLRRRRSSEEGRWTFHIEL